MANKKQIIQALIFLSIIAIVGILIWSAKAGTWKTNPSATSRITITTSAIQHFDYQKDITFNTTSTGAAVATSQSNFPIAVHINSSSWTTAAERNHFFSDTYNPGGKRVKFFDSDKTTELDYEVEYYDTAIQEALYWVRVPQVDGNSSTDKIVVAYGNDPNGSNQDNKTGVWDSNFKMVQHMQDTTTSTITDSTSNANNGTKVAANNPIQATGQVKYGQSFDGTDDYIIVSDNAGLRPATSLTMSIWINTGTTGAEVIFDKYSGSTGGSDAIANRGTAIAIVSGVVYGSIGNGTNATHTTSLSNPNNGAWHYVAFSYDNPNMSLTIDNTEEDTDISTNYVPSTEPLQIGDRFDTPNFEYTGIADEARFSNIKRSSDWIKLEYYSMKKTNFNGDNGVSSPFITHGAEQSARGAGTKRTTVFGKAIQAYTYKKAITFDTTTAGASTTDNVTGFPIAVHLNTSSWATQAERDAFFDNAGTDGKRASFFDTDQDTALPYEVEYFSNVQGSEEALYWVKVPQIDANSSTDKIYVGYGNDPYHADMNNPQAVWDSNFKMVQHMNDTTTSTITDSTSNANNGTKVAANNPIQAIGQVKYGQDFVTDDYIGCGDISSSIFDGVGNKMTLSVNIQADAVNNNKMIASKNYASGGKATFYFSRNSQTIRAFASNALTGDGYFYWTTNNNVITTTTDFYYVTAAFDLSTETILLYVNGAVQAATKGEGGTGDGPTVFPNTDYPFEIGCYSEAGPTRAWLWDGVIDEMRLSKGTRSADWIKLEYYSMAKTNFNGDNGVSSPFITFGSQEATR